MYILLGLVALEVLTKLVGLLSQLLVEVDVTCRFQLRSQDCDLDFQVFDRLPEEVVVPDEAGLLVGCILEVCHLFLDLVNVHTIFFQPSLLVFEC